MSGTSTGRKTIHMQMEEQMFGEQIFAMSHREIFPMEIKLSLAIALLQV